MTILIYKHRFRTTKFNTNVNSCQMHNKEEAKKFFFEVNYFLLFRAENHDQFRVIITNFL